MDEAMDERREVDLYGAPTSETPRVASWWRLLKSGRRVEQPEQLALRRGGGGFAEGCFYMDIAHRKNHKEAHFFSFVAVVSDC